MNTFDNTNCTLIDWSPLNEALTDQIGKPVRIEGFEALVTAGPEPMLLDREIVAKRAVNGKFTLPVFDYPTYDEQGQTSIVIFPCFDVHLTMDQILGCLGESVSLAEYVGDRRGYNARLSNNEYSVREWLNA